MRLLELSPTMFTRIEEILSLRYADDTREFIGEELYNEVIAKAEDTESLDLILRALDLTMNKNSDNKILFDALGNRLVRTRPYLEQTIRSTQLDFLYRTITSEGDTSPCARVIIEELYFALFERARRGESGFGSWEETVRNLEKDLTEPNKEMQNYFVMLGDSGNDNLLGVYNHHRSLRAQGVTIKGLIDDTWREELEAQSSEENIK